MATDLKIPALGTKSHLFGSLYSSRTDSFLKTTLFDPEKSLPQDAIIATKHSPHETSQQSIDGHSYKSRYELLGINSNLGCSILTGLTTIEEEASGIAEYLRTGDGNTDEGQDVWHECAVRYTIRTTHEELDMSTPSFKSTLGSGLSLKSSEVTHLVSEIDYGVENILVARCRLPSNISGQNSLETISRLQAEVASFVDNLKNATIPTAASELPPDSLELTIFSDALDSSIIVHDFTEAYDFFKSVVPLHLKNELGAKGKIISYSLLPVSMLSLFRLPVQHTVDLPLTTLSENLLGDIIQLFDSYRRWSSHLRKYQSFIGAHGDFVPTSHIVELIDHVRKIKEQEDDLKRNTSVELTAARAGKGDQNLIQLRQQHRMESSTLETTKQLVNKYRGNVEFVDRLVTKGARYIGFNDRDLQLELLTHGDKECYVLYIGEEAKKDETSWKANKALFTRLLDDPQNKDIFVVFDCDAREMPLEKAHISQYKDSKEISNDVVEQRQFLANQSFARYNPVNLETKDIQKPVKRRFVKIPCPSESCDRKERCEWLCSRCAAPIEFGFSDQYFYCDCGRSLFDTYDFKCRGENHGPGFELYDRRTLLSRLAGLKQNDYLNILILGETGVGKSTFINAFVNYLTFETLEEAKKAEKFNWVIPCSFATQIMDRERGNIEEIRVQVGTRNDEADGSRGASATQQTIVYPVTIGSSIIRLIDTPGIGDTRGITYDRKNMADILSTLSNYDELHGILILVKSNNARLTVTFSFCVKELLTHLHLSAAKNTAFGFTNTRISNYTPGDTFGPLNELLQRGLSNVGLSLTAKTSYCFDSESFRYLAAYKNGVNMGNEEDFARSWRHSRDEAWRLIDHYKSLQPHQVKSTISLNGTRNLISELTKPMADISQLIRTNIALCEDRMQELRNTRLTGDQLRKRLHLKKIILKPETLSQPRTVCHHIDCTETKDDGNGENKVVTVYNSHCHPVCYLTDVKADQIAHPGLVNCAAFNGTQNCKKCRHKWDQHLHVLYELKEQTANVKDSEIEKQLQSHADDITLKQTALKELQVVIQEYRSEHEQIQKAAAQFGAFLWKYSITPYNDATLAYLDFMIKEEDNKIAAGGNKKRRQALVEDYHKHEEMVQVLKSNMVNDPNVRPLTEEQIDQLVKKLYRLKHFGVNLQKVKQTTAAAHQATYREIPHRINTRGSRSGGWGLGNWFPMFEGSSSHGHGGSHSSSHHHHHDTDQHPSGFAAGGYSLRPMSYASETDPDEAGPSKEDGKSFLRRNPFPWGKSWGKKSSGTS